MQTGIRQTIPRQRQRWEQCAYKTRLTREYWADQKLGETGRGEASQKEPTSYQLSVRGP